MSKRDLGKCRTGHELNIALDRSNATRLRQSGSVEVEL